MWKNFYRIIYAANGAKRNKDDQAIFSKDGPNLKDQHLQTTLKLFQKCIDLRIIRMRKT